MYIHVFVSLKNTLSTKTVNKKSVRFEEICYLPETKYTHMYSDNLDYWISTRIVARM